MKTYEAYRQGIFNTCQTETNSQGGIVTLIQDQQMVKGQFSYSGNIDNVMEDTGMVPIKEFHAILNEVVEIPIREFPSAPPKIPAELPKHQYGRNYSQGGKTMADENKSKTGILVLLGAAVAAGAFLFLRQPVQASNDKIVIQSVQWV